MSSERSDDAEEEVTFATLTPAASGKAPKSLSTLGQSWVFEQSDDAWEPEGLQEAELVSGKFLDPRTLLQSSLGRIVIQDSNAALLTKHWCDRVTADECSLRQKVQSAQAVENILAHSNNNTVASGDAVEVNVSGVWIRGAVVDVDSGSLECRIKDPDGTSRTVSVAHALVRSVDDAAHPDGDSFAKRAQASKFATAFPFTVAIQLSLAVLRNSSGNDDLLRAALESVFDLLRRAEGGCMFNNTDQGTAVLDSLANFLTNLPLHQSSPALCDVVFGLLILMAARSGQLALFFSTQNKMLEAENSAPNRSEFRSRTYSQFVPFALVEMRKLTDAMLLPGSRPTLKVYWEHFGVFVRDDDVQEESPDHPDGLTTSDIVISAKSLLESESNRDGKSRATAQRSASEVRLIKRVETHLSTPAAVQEPLSFSTASQQLSETAEILASICVTRALAVIKLSQESLRGSGSTDARNSALCRLPDNFLLESVESTVGSVQLDVIIDTISSIFASPQSLPVENVGVIISACLSVIDSIVTSQTYSKSAAETLMSFSTKLVQHPFVASSTCTEPSTDEPEVLSHASVLEAAIIRLHVLCSSRMFSAKESYSFMTDSFARLLAESMSSLELSLFESFMSSINDLQVQSLVTMDAHLITNLWDKLVDVCGMSLGQNTTTRTVQTTKQHIVEHSKSLLLRMTIMWGVLLKDEFLADPSSALSNKRHVDLVMYVFRVASTSLAPQIPPQPCLILELVLPRIVGALCIVLDSFIIDSNKVPLIRALVQLVPPLLRLLRASVARSAERSNGTDVDDRNTLETRIHEALSVLLSLLVRGLLLSVRITVSEWVCGDAWNDPLLQQDNETMYKIVAGHGAVDLATIARGEENPTVAFLQGSISFALRDTQEANDTASENDLLFTTSSSDPLIALWQNPSTFHRLVQFLRAKKRDDLLQAAGKGPETKTEGVHVATFALVLKHTGLLESFLKFAEEILSEDSDSTSRDMEFDAKWRKLWNQAEILPATVSTAAASTPEWDEEATCTQTLKIEGSTVTKFSSNPDYGTAFAKFQFEEGCIHDATFSITRSLGGSVYIGIALSSISNRSGFASSSMINKNWYMRNQGELRCGSRDILKSKKPFTTNDTLRLHVELGAQRQISFFLTSAATSSNEELVGSIEIPEEVRAEDLRFVVCIDDSRDSVSLDEVGIVSGLQSTTELGPREIELASMLLNIQRPVEGQQMPQDLGRTASPVPGLEPIPLGRQSTAERWDNFVSSAAFQQVHALLQLSEWRLHEDSSPTKRLQNSTEAQQSSQKIVSLIQTIVSSGVDAVSFQEARAQKRRRALSRAEGTLLLATVVSDFNTFIASHQPLLGKANAAKLYPTLQQVMSDMSLVLNSFAFATRTMNNPDFECRFAKGRYQLSKLLRISETPIFKEPTSNGGQLVGHLRSSHLFLIDKTSSTVVMDDGPQVWHQLVSGNWICTKSGDEALVGSAPAVGSNTVVLRPLRTDNHPETHHWHITVDPMQHLHGSGADNTVLVEPLAGLFLSFKNLIQQIRLLPRRLAPAQHSLLKSAIVAASMDLLDRHQLKVFAASGLVDEVVATSNSCDLAATATESLTAIEPDAGDEVVLSTISEVDGQFAGRSVDILEGPSVDSTVLSQSTSTTFVVTDFNGEFAKLREGGWVRVHDAARCHRFFEITDSEATAFHVFIRNMIGVPTDDLLQIYVGGELSLIVHPVSLDLSACVESPHDPHDIIVHRSEDIELCNALVRNIAVAIPAFVRPDLSAPVVKKVAQKRQVKVDEPTMSLPAVCDAFNNHLLKSTHSASISAGNELDGATSLKASLAGVFVNRLEAEVDKMPLHSYSSGAESWDAMPSWCQVISSEPICCAALVDDGYESSTSVPLLRAGGRLFLFHMFVTTENAVAGTAYEPFELVSKRGPDAVRAVVTVDADAGEVGLSLRCCGHKGRSRQVQEETVSNSLPLTPETWVEVRISLWPSLPSDDNCMHMECGLEIRPVFVDKDTDAPVNSLAESFRTPALATTDCYIRVSQCPIVSLVHGILTCPLPRKAALTAEVFDRIRPQQLSPPTVNVDEVSRGAAIVQSICTQLAKIVSNTSFVMSDDQIEKLFRIATALVFPCRKQVPVGIVRSAALQVLRHLCVERKHRIQSMHHIHPEVRVVLGRALTELRRATAPTVFAFLDANHQSRMVPRGNFLDHLKGFVRSIAEQSPTGTIEPKLADIWNSTPKVLQMVHDGVLSSEGVSGLQQLVMGLETLARRDVCQSVGSPCVASVAGALDAVGIIVHYSPTTVEVLLDDEVVSVDERQVKWTFQHAPGKANEERIIPVGNEFPSHLKEAVVAACHSILQCDPPDGTVGRSGCLASVFARLQCAAMLALRSYLEFAGDDSQISKTTELVVNWLSKRASAAKKQVPPQLCGPETLESSHPMVSRENQSAELFFPNAVSIVVELDTRSELDPEDQLSVTALSDQGEQHTVRLEVGRHNRFVCHTDRLRVDFKCGSAMSQAHWGWRVVMVPSILVRKRAVSDLATLTVSNMLAKGPLARKHSVSSWKCPTEFEICQQKKSLTKQATIRWATQKGEVAFCHECALFLSQTKQVLTFAQPLQPTYKKSSGWRCDDVSPYCLREKLRQGYKGIRWTARNKNDSYDLCDACAAFFGLDNVQCFGNQFARCFSLPFMKDKRSLSTWFDRAATMSEVQPDRLSLAHVASTAENFTNINFVTGTGTLFGPRAQRAKGLRWRFALKIFAGTHINVGWTSGGFDCQRGFVLPEWAESKDLTFDGSKFDDGIPVTAGDTLQCEVNYGTGKFSIFINDNELSSVLVPLLENMRGALSPIVTYANSSFKFILSPNGEILKRVDADQSDGVLASSIAPMIPFVGPVDPGFVQEGARQIVEDSVGFVTLDLHHDQNSRRIVLQNELNTTEDVTPRFRALLEEILDRSPNFFTATRQFLECIAVNAAHCALLNTSARENSKQFSLLLHHKDVDGSDLFQLFATMTSSERSAIQPHLIRMLKVDESKQRQFLDAATNFTAHILQNALDAPPAHVENWKFANPSSHSICPVNVNAFLDIHLLSDIISVNAQFPFALVKSPLLALRLAELCVAAPRSIRRQVYDLVGVVFDSLAQTGAVTDHPMRPWRRFARTVMLRASVVARKRTLSLNDRSLLRCSLCASNFAASDSLAVASTARSLATTLDRFTDKRSARVVRVQLIGSSRGFTFNSSNLTVSSIEEDSPAFRDGLRVQHKIVEVNGQGVKSVDEFNRLAQGNEFQITLSCAAARYSQLQSSKVDAAIRQCASHISSLAHAPDTICGAAKLDGGDVDTQLWKLRSLTGWKLLQLKSEFSSGCHQWEVKIESTAYSHDDTQAKLVVGVSSAAHLVDATPLTLRKTIGFQFSSTPSETLIESLGDCSTPTKLRLPPLMSGDVILIDLELSGESEQKSYGLRVQVNRVPIASGVWLASASSNSQAANAVVALDSTDTLIVVVRAASCYEVDHAIGNSGGQLIQLINRDHYLHRSSLALAELRAKSAQFQTPLVESAALGPTGFESTGTMRNPSPSALFDTLVKREHLEGQQMLSCSRSSLGPAEWKVLDIEPQEADFVSVQRTAGTFDSFQQRVYLDVPADASGKTYQSIPLAAPQTESGGSQHVDFGWSETMSLQEANLFIDGGLAERRSGSGPDYYNVISKNGFGRGDTASWKVVIRKRRANYYVGLVDPAHVNLGRGLQRADLRNNSWYLRYSGEVRTGDNDLYRSSCRYQSGTEVEIRFDGTTDPMTVCFFCDGESTGEPVEMKPSNPDAFFHVIACLDENNDAIEILDMKATSRTGGACGRPLGSSPVVAHGMPIGSPVVRGPAWVHGLTDGGPGNVGYVMRLVPPLDPSRQGVAEVWWRGSQPSQTHKYPVFPEEDPACVFAHHFPQTWICTGHANVSVPAFAEPSSKSEPVDFVNDNTLTVLEVRAAPSRPRCACGDVFDIGVAPAVEYENGWWCDTCGKLMPASSRRYFCTKCFHDQCFQCRKPMADHDFVPKAFCCFQRNSTPTVPRVSLLSEVDRLLRASARVKLSAKARCYDLNNSDAGIPAVGTFRIIANDSPAAPLVEHIDDGGARVVFGCGEYKLALQDDVVYVFDARVESRLRPVEPRASIPAVGTAVSVSSSTGNTFTRGTVAANKVCDGVSMTTVNLDWSLADGCSAVLHVPSDQVTRLSTQNYRSFSFQFIDTKSASDAYATMSTSSTESASYADIVAKRAKSHDIWLRIAPSRWIMAQNNTVASSHSLQFVPDSRLLQPLAPLWRGPAVFGQGCRLRVCLEGQSALAERVGVWHAALMNLELNFAESCDILSQNPSLLELGWKLIRARDGPSDNEAKELEMWELIVHSCGVDDVEIDTPDAAAIAKGLLDMISEFAKPGKRFVCNGDSTTTPTPTNLNAAGFKMNALGYCGRKLGRAAIPGSDGQCGPNNGPHCADCKLPRKVPVTQRNADGYLAAHNGSFYFCNRTLVAAPTTMSAGSGRCGPDDGDSRCSACAKLVVDSNPSPLRVNGADCAMYVGPDLLTWYCGYSGSNNICDPEKGVQCHHCQDTQASRLDFNDEGYPLVYASDGRSPCCQRRIATTSSTSFVCGGSATELQFCDSCSRSTAMRMNVANVCRFHHQQAIEYEPRLQNMLKQQRQAKSIWTEQIENLMVRFLDKYGSKNKINFVDDSPNTRERIERIAKSIDKEMQAAITASSQVLGSKTPETTSSIFSRTYLPLHKLFVNERVKGDSTGKFLCLRPSFLIKYILDLNLFCTSLSQLLDVDETASSIFYLSGPGHNTHNDADTIARCLSDARHLLLGATMRPVCAAALKAFPKPPSASQPTIVLRRKLADVSPTSESSSDSDPSGLRSFARSFNQSTFGQVFAQLRHVGDGVYFRTGHIWKATLAGFNSVDAGGPFRESIAMLCDDLLSSTLPLFLPTPNNRQNVGSHRGDFLPNPSLRGENFANMYIFIGKLMGMALRSGELLPLSLPPLFWARLVRSPVTTELLSQSHHTHVKAMRQFATIHFSESDASIVLDGNGDEVCQASDFDDLFCKDFTMVGIDGTTHDLVPGGRGKSVQVEDAAHYANLALEHSVHEVDWAIDRIREGLTHVIPSLALSFMRWDHVEAQVCGSPKVDLELLRSVAEYEGFSATDDVIRYFWEVMEDLSNKNRAQVRVVMFVCFASFHEPTHCRLQACVCLLLIETLLFGRC